MRDEYDVIVVGAGPAGSMAARFAAEQGVSVLMLEKDRDVGYPVRCAEGISKRGLVEFIEPDKKFIAAHINKFSITSPEGTEVLMDNVEDAYVLERRVFDYELAKTAAKAGAEILTRAYVYDLILENNKTAGVKFEYRGEKKEIRSKIVIAADGVESRVGRWAGIKTHTDFRDMECCAQYTVGNIPLNSDTLYFYFGKDVAPNGYLWVFPKGENTANIGLGISGIAGKKRSALSFLDDFMTKHFPNASILTQVAGGVPCSTTLEQIAAPGILLVGDAARQVNPLSGGGISSGMKAGSIGGRIAGEAVLKNDLNHIFTYEKEWHEKLGKRHETYDKLKNFVFNFSDERLNNLAVTMNKIPLEKRTMGKLFSKALISNPAMILEAAKVFVMK